MVTRQSAGAHGVWLLAHFFSPPAEDLSRLQAGSHTHHTKAYQGARKGARCKIRACFQSASPLSSLRDLCCLTLSPSFTILVSLELLLLLFPFPSPSLFRFLFQGLIPTCWHSPRFSFFPFPFSSQFTFCRSYFHASMATSLPVTSSFIFHTLVSSSYLVVL